jgi:hypothetical protein
VYEKEQEPDQRATSVQGRENGYFAFTQSDGTVEESFETVLADRENECNEILLLARSKLYHWPYGSQDKLAFYAAQLFRRATQQRAFGEKNWQETIDDMHQAAQDDEYIKKLIEDLKVKRDITISEEAVRNSILTWVENAVQPAYVRNNFITDLLDNAKLGAALLLKKKPWRVVRPPEGTEFVTSDNPLVTFVPLGNGVLHPGYGLGREDAVAAFPLAPDACLLMGHAWQVPSSFDSAAVSSVNDVVISISDRYVYSRSFSAEIKGMVDKFGGSCRYGVNAFMPLGLNMPLPRQFLRTRFGLDP